MPARAIAFGALVLLFSGRAYGQAPMTGPAAPVVGDLAPEAPYESELIGADASISSSWLDSAQASGAELPPIPKSWLMSAWNPQPTIEARVEAVFLKPNFPESPSFAIENRIQANNTVAQSQLPLDRGEDNITAIAARFDLHFNEFKSLDVSGFWLDGPDSGNLIGQPDLPKFLDANAANPNRRGFMRNQLAGFPTLADDMRVDWYFQSYGADANFNHHFILQNGPISDLVLGVGARYFWMQESVTFTAFNELDRTTGRMFARTENALAGPQIVGRVRFQSPLKRIRASAESKIALTANSISEQTEVSTDVARANFRQNKVQFAPLFEGNFLFQYMVFEHMTLFGGYQLLFVNRVDRAVELMNPDLNAFVGPQKEIGTLFMHGPRAGVEIHY